MATVAEPVAAIRQAVAAYLTVKGAASAIDFYKRAFGAIEKGRLTMPSGEIGHAEIEIGGSTIMLSDEFPDYGSISPERLGGSPIKLHLYVDDVDAHCVKATAAGATIVDQPKLHDYGEDYWADRSYGAADPEGHLWWFTQRIRNPQSR